jgi:aspartyl protease family protein
MTGAFTGTMAEYGNRLHGWEMAGEMSGFLVRRMAHSIALAGALACAWSATWATDVSVVGLFPGKAVVVVNGGPPRTLSVGTTTAGGVKLISVDGTGATLEFDGDRRHLAIGEQAMSTVRDNSASAVVTLRADGQGHFITSGAVNGSSLRFVVDTGATLVSLSAADAVRAGIQYRKGVPGMVLTANGPTQVWRVKLDTLQIGDITLHEVDAAVHAVDLPVALLGMSFLNRMEMNRDGETMTLRRRF